MADRGTTNISASIPIDLWNDTVATREFDNVGLSRYIQSALRHHNRRVKKREIVEFMDSLGEKELNLLKEEIKKRS